MENINVDTIKIKESAKDILNLSKEFNELIDVFFSRIANMNTNTGEWIGNASNEFIRISNIQKTDYKNFVKALNDYGNFLSMCASQYENCIKNME